MSNEKLDLSIVIPVYNSWNSCTNIVKRILDLKNDLVEIIIIDDGSITKPIASSEELFNNKKVQIINLKVNGGVSRARNIGFRASRGKFVWFFDSDDQIGKDFNSVLDVFKKSKDKDFDLFILNYSVIDTSGVKYSRDIILDKGLERDNHLHEYILASNFSYNRLMPVIWRYIIRRDFLLSNFVFFNDTRVYEDNAYICKLMVKRPQTFVLEGEAYKHVRNTHSLSSYLDPSDIGSFYSDVIVSSFSILHDLNYELAHYNNDNIISYLESQLRMNVTSLLFSYSFLTITRKQEQKWKDIISSLKQCRTNIFSNFSIIIEDDIVTTYNSFKKFIFNKMSHMPKSSSVGIYCVSTFSITCAKLLIDNGANVKCFFDKQFSSDILIDNIKFPVKKFSNDSESNFNLDFIIIINRRREVCLEILGNINIKNISLITIYME